MATAAELLTEATKLTAEAEQAHAARRADVTHAIARAAFWAGRAAGAGAGEAGALLVRLVRLRRLATTPTEQA